MDFLSAILGPVVESLLEPVKKHLGYLFSSTKHVSNMSTRMKQLDGTSHDVKNHMETNNISNLEIPARVPDWLKEVEKIKEDAERIISSDVNGCFNLKIRYRAGRKAFKTTQQIEALINENEKITWSNAQKALGKVSSKVASTSGPSDGDGQNDFKSREKIFKEALGLLQQDQKAQVIALWGMGGVGKTTMMEQLKKAVENKKMFDYVVKVVIGQKVNTFSIQQTVAEDIGCPLTVTDKTARADRLRIAFEKISQKSKKKVLVVLDDVWEKVELKDIGLSPLPNGFKLLLTSRDENVCAQIAVDAKSYLGVVKVDLMEESEANDFFCQITEVSNPELKDIGVKIVRRCGFLPLAIKLIAATLYKSEEKSVWRDRLRRLEKNVLDNSVQSIIEISYNFIAKEEDAEKVFLLCGLFPDDFNIRIEDLTRYAWGLKLLSEVTTLGEARDRTRTCVHILKNASLLMDSDYSECVKMHDLVLAFVVAKVSKGDHPWIINHGDVSNWSRAEMSESCRRISLTCMGMSEFPRDFNYSNVSLLRLMNGDESLKFPDDFYEKMKNLQVMAYEKLQYPLLPRSLQCSTKLQTLCLHQCSLMFDCSPIGDHLLNLEVLSFAGSGIRYLPSAIRNLVQLKLLDLTGCIDLRIDEGVLKNLVRLEELYMTVADKEGITFTDINYKELEERSKNLCALEVEFFENSRQSKNMSYNKLERFKISMGRFLEYDGDVHKSDNRLMLFANKDELLESGLNELFSKTEVLYLEAVGGMNNLEEVLPKSVPLHSFYNLRVLRVTKCADLRYLFTVPVASGLLKLERLTVSDCPVMQALVYGENGEEAVISMNNVEEVTPKSVPRHSPFYNLGDLRVSGCADLSYLFTFPVASGLVKLERLTVSDCPVMKALVYSENGEEGVDIRFQELKHLRLKNLPMLVGLSNTNDVIHLPRLVVLELVLLPKFTSIYPEYKSTSITSSGSSPIKPFFNKEAMIPPKLEKLEIYEMEALKNIWVPCGSSQEVDATCLLREITVMSCYNLVNMFPSNPMPLLHHLETIFVAGCGSIEVLFDIDVGCIGEIKEGSSKLRSIQVHHSGKLREVWRLKGGGVVNINHPSDDLIICGCFQAVEVIRIRGCKRFRHIFTPTTARFDLGALRTVSIIGADYLKKSEEENKESVERKEEIDDTSKGEIIQVADNIPYVAYPFNLLRTFHHLRSFTLNQLTDVVTVFEIEIATSRDLTTWDNQQPPILCHLEDLRLLYLEKMNCVWKCNWNHFLYYQKQKESPFQNLTTIVLYGCGKIKYLFSPFMAKLLINLKTITISQCDGIEEVVSNRDDDIQTMAASTSSCTNPTLFPHLDSLLLSCLSKLKFIHDGATRGNGSEITSNVISNISIHENSKSSEVDVVSWSLCQYPRKIEISKCSSLSTVIPFNAVGKLQKLQELKISQCNLLEHVFTSSTLESLKQLKELTVEDCKIMKVIVKEDDLKEDGEHTTSKIVVFPQLKSLTLTDLPNVKGFFLGMNEFRWPHLDKVKIFGCPQMTVFTHGHSMTPKLNYMHTGLGKHSLECGLNFELTNASNETQFRSSSMCSTPDMIKLLQYPCSFSNLVEVDTKLYNKSTESRIFFPHNELHKLHNLEKLNIAPPPYSYPRILIVAEEVFEVVEETNDYLNETQSVVVFPKLKEVTLEELGSVKHIWKSNQRIVLNFPNLTKVSINRCPLLGNVLTSCMVDSLLQLQELHISECENMEVVVKQVEDSETRANEVVEFPRLKSVTLSSLKNLKGFYLGSEAFMWPLLDTLKIKGCPQITVFTCGQSTTPELKVIDTSFGLCYATEDPTSFLQTKQQEGWQF